MDFRIFFQLREKRFWWIDVIFYFAISLLAAAVFCYLIFLIKNSIQLEEINYHVLALQTVGTEQQKDYEEEVISYQKKISDFVKLFENHEFASNVFAFMEKQTLPEVWFRQFNLDGKSDQVQLSGESKDMEVFSRQVDGLERNEYVKSVGNLTSALGESARIQFNFNLALDAKIFGYISDVDSATAVTESGQPILESNQNLGSQKLITIFDLLLAPEVIGVIDQTNYTVKLDVPYGTDLTNVETFIVVSPDATVEPASNIPQDFTNPVLYKVTAQDGSTQNYTVTVNILPEGGAEKTEESKPANVWLVIILILIIIAAISAIVFFSIKKFKKKKQVLKNEN